MKIAEGQTKLTMTGKSKEIKLNHYSQFHQGIITVLLPEHLRDIHLFACLLGFQTSWWS